MKLLMMNGVLAISILKVSACDPTGEDPGQLGAVRFVELPASPAKTARPKPGSPNPIPEESMPKRELPSPGPCFPKPWPKLDPIPPQLPKPRLPWEAPQWDLPSTNVCEND